jgi:hypothetical protein
MCTTTEPGSYIIVLATIFAPLIGTIRIAVILWEATSAQADLKTTMQRICATYQRTLPASLSRSGPM